MQKEVINRYLLFFSNFIVVTFDVIVDVVVVIGGVKGESVCTGVEMAETFTNVVKSEGAASIICFSFDFTVSLIDSYIDTLSPLVILFNDVKLKPRLKLGEIRLFIIQDNKKINT